MGKSISERMESANFILLGKWWNDSLGLFFNGSDSPDGTGEILIGDINLAIYGSARYKVIIKNEDIFIQLTFNESANNDKFKDYRVVEVEERRLVVESPEGAALLFVK